MIEPIEDVETASEEPQSIKPSGCPKCGRYSLDGDRYTVYCQRTDCDYHDSV